MWVLCGFDVFLVALLVPFCTWHVLMVMRNQTTIDGKRFPQYDMGVGANVRQVFGPNPWTWLLPCYCSGPEGDGLRWPTRQAGSQRLRTLV